MLELLPAQGNCEDIPLNFWRFLIDQRIRDKNTKQRHKTTTKTQNCYKETQNHHKNTHNHQKLMKLKTTTERFTMCLSGGLPRTYDGCGAVWPFRSLFSHYHFFFLYYFICKVVHFWDFKLIFSTCLCVQIWTAPLLQTTSTTPSEERRPPAVMLTRLHLRPITSLTLQQRIQFMLKSARRWHRPRLLLLSIHLSRYRKRKRRRKRSLHLRCLAGRQKWRDDEEHRRLKFRDRRMTAMCKKWKTRIMDERCRGVKHEKQGMNVHKVKHERFPI